MSRNDESMDYEDYKAAHGTDPEFEDRLARALAIDVPKLEMPELPEIDGDNVVPLAPGRRIPSAGWLAAAATVVLGAFVGIRMFGTDTVDATLEQQLLAHLDHEPAALRVTDQAVSDRRLARVVPANVATMNHDAGLITYAKTCHINGNEIPHLVIQGDRGPVTILLMPKEKVDGARKLDGVSVQGVILPVGEGSIAIIGERDESLDRIKENVLESVNWST